MWEISLPTKNGWEELRLSLKGMWTTHEVAYLSKLRFIVNVYCKLQDDH